MKRLARTIPLSALFVFFAFAVSAAGRASTQKDLDASLNYYRKVYSERTFTPNDRLAVLVKIKNKYASSNLDFSDLDKEIETQKKLRSAAGSAVPAAAPPVPVGKIERPVSPPSPRPRLSDISIIEKSDIFEINIISDKPASHNVFVLKDPDPSIPPKIVVDLYGLHESLPASKKEISFNTAGIDKIRAAQFEKEPEPIVRIVVFLKKSVVYNLKETPAGAVLSLTKETGEKNKTVTAFAAPPLTEEAPAPSPPALSSAAVPSIAATAIPQPAVSVEKRRPPSPRTEYKIEPGDVLSINVFPSEELSREVVVNPGGEISLPLIGVAVASGRTAAALADALKNAYAEYITNPDVTVVVKQYARRTVFITGELKSTGGYPYKENLRLLELISQAGGFSERADRKNVKIIRGDGAARKTFKVDIEEIVRSGDFSKDFALEPGDIVEVPSGFKKISILGDVRSPGYYDYKEGLKTVEAVSLAGGFLDTARITSVSVLRKDGDKTQSIKVNLDEILKGKKADYPLLADDTVYIPRKTLSSANWWVSNVMPWLSLISLILVLRGGI